MKVTETRVVLEIGPGRSPLTAVGRTIQSNEHYIGVELDRYERWSSEQKIKRVRPKHDGKLSLVRGDGRSLPLSDNSVHDVYIGNVFGEDREDNQSHELITQELQRIVKVDGKITVVETITPYPFRQLNNLFHEVGFRMTSKKFGKKPNFNYVKKERRYTAVFRKGREETLFRKLIRHLGIKAREKN